MARLLRAFVRDLTVPELRYLVCHLHSQDGKAEGRLSFVDMLKVLHALPVRVVSSSGGVQNPSLGSLQNPSSLGGSRGAVGGAGLQMGSPLGAQGGPRGVLGGSAQGIPQEWLLQEVTLGGKVYLLDKDTSVVYAPKGEDGWPQAVGNMQVRFGWVRGRIFIVARSTAPLVRREFNICHVFLVCEKAVCSCNLFRHNL